MVAHTLFRFNNTHSVRFNLDSFALPVAVTKKKNTIYADYISGLLGTKRKLLPAPAPLDKHGYLHVAAWNEYLFVSDDHALYYGKSSELVFHRAVNGFVYPQQLLVANDRLFFISYDRKRVVYSVPLSGGWQEEALMSAGMYIPEVYGKCRHLALYQNKLLVVCDYGSLTVDKHLKLQHLTDDSESLRTSLAAGNDPEWRSDWFTLGYATDTQSLREVFLKTNVPLTMVVESNRTQRAIHVAAGSKVQKLKVNLNGDQFKISLYPSSANCNISNLSAIVTYGKRG